MELASACVVTYCLLHNILCAFFDIKYSYSGVHLLTPRRPFSARAKFISPGTTLDLFTVD